MTENLPKFQILCRKRQNPTNLNSAAKRQRLHSIVSRMPGAAQLELQNPIEEEKFDPTTYVKIKKYGTKWWTKGPVRENKYRMEPIRDLNFRDPQEKLLRILAIMNSAFSTMLKDAPPNSKAQVYLVNPQINSGVIPSKKLPIEELRFEDLAKRLCAVLQSDESVKLEDTIFYLSTFAPQMTLGHPSNGLQARKSYSIQLWQKHKHCMYDPVIKDRLGRKSMQNMENMCLPLILAREIYLVRNPNMSRKQATKCYVNTETCSNDARQLVTQAGLQPEFGPFSMTQIKEFEKCLPKNTTVCLYDDAAPPILEIVSQPEGQTDMNRINIFIAYNETERGIGTDFHAYGITRMNAFMGCRKYCYVCQKGVSKQRHKCKGSLCKICKYPQCKNRTNVKSGRRYYCDKCQIYYFSLECQKAHEVTCDQMQKCSLCSQIWPKNDSKKHSCGKPYCKYCLNKHSPFEYCYVQPDKPKKVELTVWYGDCETQIDPVTKEHQVNLAIFQRHDGGKFIEFKGAAAMEQFTRACITKDSIFKKSTVVFHNGSGFDAHFWYKELLKAKVPPKKITRKGQKIIGMTLNQNEIKCRDSLQFIPATPLAAFPKMFGLKSGPKGDFPHGLNTPEWIQFGSRKVYKEMVKGVEHKFPRIEYFWPHLKDSKQLERLKIWHAEMVAKYRSNPALEYVPEDELVSYCRTDVQILRLAFETYRSTWLAQYPELEPLENLTFPSYNNKIFRNIYMPKDSLCLLPPMGYESKNQLYSVTAMAWIAWQEKVLGLRQVRSARKGYEVKISGHRVDATGTDGEGNRHVLNLNGCFWHGCSCQKKRNEILEIRRENTAATDEHLRKLAKNPQSPYGQFTYHVIYECEFWAAVKNNVKMSEFVKDYIDRFPKEPLRPRLALRGGRTNAIHHRIVPVEIKAGWRLYYLDFTSLYPSVNFGMHGEIWPLGHPLIYIGADLDQLLHAGQTWSSDWFGFANIEIHPPRKLLHPVLGQLINDKLLFHLCACCAQELYQGPCPHSDADRIIAGTFFTGEIELAIKNGYRVEKVPNWLCGQLSS